MLPLIALQSMRVMIASPCALGSTSNFVTSLAVLSGECTSLGLPLQIEMPAQSSITRSRNKLVAAFLSNPALTHLFFIDADVGFEADAFFRLLLADRDVVAGVYPLKEFLWPPEGLPKGMTQKEFEARYTRYPINTLDHGRLESDKESFAEVAEATTGFICIKRGVIEKMKTAYPELEYAADTVPANSLAPHSHWLFFENMTTPETKRYLTEDYAFCRRWRDIGGKVYIDITSKLSHHGQHIWRGDLLAHLETKAKK